MKPESDAVSGTLRAPRSDQIWRLSAGGMGLTRQEPRPLGHEVSRAEPASQLGTSGASTPIPQVSGRQGTKTLAGSPLVQAEAPARSHRQEGKQCEMSDWFGSSRSQSRPLR
jgi:hypothetical protein